MNMGDFQGMLKVWIELTWRHPIYNFDPFLVGFKVEEGKQ